MQYTFRKYQIKASFRKRKLQYICLDEMSSRNCLQTILSNIYRRRNISTDPLAGPRLVQHQRRAESAAAARIQNPSVAGKKAAHLLDALKTVPVHQPFLECTERLRGFIGFSLPPLETKASTRLSLPLILG